MLRDQENLRIRFESRRPSKGYLEHSQIIIYLSDIYDWNERMERKMKLKNAKKLKDAQKHYVSNSHNIVSSIHDRIPLSKFTPETQRLFRRLTYASIAKNYPYVLLSFLVECKELIISEVVLRDLVKIANEEIKIRSER